MALKSPAGRPLLPSETVQANDRNNGRYGGEPSKKIFGGTDITKTAPPTNTVAGNSHRIGFIDSNNRGFGLDEELLSMHLLLLGGIGCGKTNVFYFILESLLARLSSDDVIIIFDTKGDYKRIFFDPYNPRHILISNDQRDVNLSCSWNMFAELLEPDGTFSKYSEQGAKEIGKKLFFGRESSTQPFFASAAADLVTKAIINLMRKAKRDHTERSLHTADLVKFLNEANLTEYDKMITSEYNPDFRSAQMYYGNVEKVTGQSMGILSYITSMTNDLFHGIFAERRPKGSVSMRNIVRSKGAKVVFLEYDLSVGLTFGPMYSILFDIALKEALGRNSGEKGNVYLVIDEFKLLPNLEHIDDALNFGRSLGVKVIAGLQSIDQLTDNYGEARGNVIAAGFMNSFCFKTLDLNSRKYISERFGETLELYEYNTTHTTFTNSRDGHTVEDWDILALKRGQAFVDLFGYPPFKFTFQDYNLPHTII